MLAHLILMERVKKINLYFKSPQIYFIKKLGLEVSPPYFKGEGELKELIYILTLNLLDQISFHSKEVFILRDLIPLGKKKKVTLK